MRVSQIDPTISQFEQTDPLVDGLKLTIVHATEKQSVDGKAIAILTDKSGKVYHSFGKQVLGWFRSATIQNWIGDAVAKGDGLDITVSEVDATGKDGKPTGNKMLKVSPVF